MRPVLVALLLAFAAPLAAQQSQRTENLILVTLDGFRWQELFSGADSALMRSRLVRDTAATTISRTTAVTTPTWMRRNEPMAFFVSYGIGCSRRPGIASARRCSSRPIMVAAAVLNGAIMAMM